MYLYSTILFKTGAIVLGLPEDNATNLSDFETNRKSSCLQITDISISETTYLLDKSYSDFGDLITEGISWGDVRYITRVDCYELILTSDNPL